jgi:hypothetical protein
MPFGADTSSENRSIDLSGTSVANPRRVRLDADGRPEPLAPAKRPAQS